MENPKPGRQWSMCWLMVSDAQTALKVAPGRFQFEREGIQEADVTCFIPGAFGTAGAVCGGYPVVCVSGGRE